MPVYRVVLKVTADRITDVRKRAEATFGGSLIHVSKEDMAKSRADRLAVIESTVQDAAQDISELKEELEEWRDNLPESLQEGGKASELEDAIEALEELSGSLEEIDFTSVSFPGMY